MYSVLLVDDEPLAVRGNRIIIERSGLEISQIYEAKDGMEAWEFLQETSVDLVITDIKMPRLDGVNLCNKIWGAGLPCKTIIVSGYADFQYARQAIRYGVSDYILKPVQREELIQSISSVLYQTAEKEQEKLNYIPRKELENIITVLQQGLWLDRQEDVERGIEMFFQTMSKVKEDYCLTASQEFCRLIAEKLSLKTGHTIVAEPRFDKQGNKAAILKQVEDFIELVQKELLDRRKQTDYTEVLLDMAKKYLEENYYLDISLADIAERTGFSSNYFSQIFKEKTGKNFVQCRTELRIHKAMELLKWSGKSITEIAMEVGYNDSTYFFRVFKEIVGETPSSFKKREGKS